MLGIEPEILDFKFEDDPTLCLRTNQKVLKTDSGPKKGPQAENQNSNKAKCFSVT